jgi:hypothetical protein
MVYLIVGVDRDSLAPWHGHIRASHVTAAKRLAAARAARAGVDLVVAAAIGPNWRVG